MINYYSFSLHSHHVQHRHHHHCHNPTTTVTPITVAIIGTLLIPLPQFIKFSPVRQAIALVSFLRRGLLLFVIPYYPHNNRFSLHVTQTAAI
jgi:hypothetical protein